MAMRIRVSDPRLIGDLMKSLLRNGCVVQRKSAATCTVVHVDALDMDEATTELRFFLRAWQARHAPVTAALVD
jgi:hypothetical protein